jgi:hypothetical protein
VGLVIALCAWMSLVGAARAAVPGTVSTVAGNGTEGYTGNGGPATSAEFKDTYGVSVDAGGDLLFADPRNNVVRLVAGSNCTSACPYGLAAMTKGDIYTVAGTGTAGYTGDDGAAKSAKLAFPYGLALDPQGDVLIADLSNNVVRIVARASCASACPYGLRSMVLGDIYTIAGDHKAGYSGDGGPATSAALSVPEHLAVDQAGNLVIGDAQNDRVRLVVDSSCSSACPYGLRSTSAGSIYTIAGDGTTGAAGDGGPATAAELDHPTGLAFDGVGDLLIADVYNGVRLVAETSCAFDCQYGLRSMTPGDIYTVAGTGTYGFTGDGKPATSAELFLADSVAVDGVGDLLIADTGNQRIRIVPDIGCSTDCAYGLPPHWEGKGFIYTVAGNGTPGFSGDGGAATGAEFSYPSGVSVDGDGNLLIADTGNYRIRLVTASKPPPVCYETGAREVGEDGFTGTRDQEDVIVYAPAGLASITGVTVVNGTASHPAFTPGTKGPVIVTATKTAQSLAVSGYYKAPDEEGRSTYCGFYLPTG